MINTTNRKLYPDLDDRISIVDANGKPGYIEFEDLMMAVERHIIPRVEGFALVGTREKVPYDKLPDKETE